MSSYAKFIDMLFEIAGAMFSFQPSVALQDFPDLTLMRYHNKLFKMSVPTVLFFLLSRSRSSHLAVGFSISIKHV